MNKFESSEEKKMNVERRKKIKKVNVEWTMYRLQSTTMRYGSIRSYYSRTSN